LVENAASSKPPVQQLIVPAAHPPTDDSTGDALIQIKTTGAARDDAGFVAERSTFAIA
jgi:hypothetical protein